MDQEFEIVSEDMIKSGDLQRENIERLQENLNPDVIRLTSVVRSEMNAPEILPYEEALIDNITLAIQNQKEQIEGIHTSLGSKFTIEMYKMDLDRIQYMVKRYFRIRVLKIEQQLDAIMSNIEMTDCLSFKEKKFAADLHELNKTYFQETIHRRLGEVVQEEFEKSDDFHKHCQPDLNGFVVCRALREVDIDINPRAPQPKRCDKNDIFLVSYKAVQEHVKAGHIELL